MVLDGSEIVCLMEVSFMLHKCTYCVFTLYCRNPQRGYSHVKTYRDVPLKWVSFPPKILGQESKKLQKRSHLTKIEKKISLLRQKKPQKWVPICKNFKNTSKSANYSRKVLRNGQEFQTCVTHPSKYNLRTPPPNQIKPKFVKVFSTMQILTPLLIHASLI